MAKVSKEKQAELLALLQAGTPSEQIAEAHGLTRSQLGGFIGGWRREGKLPDYRPSTANPASPLHPVNIEAKKRAPGRPAGIPNRPAVAPTPVPAPTVDGFNWRPAADPGDGFSAPEIVIEVERTIPSEGLLGRHSHPFSKDDCGRTYGGGSRYKFTRYIPGRFPESTEFEVSESTYGPPRSPKRYGAGNRPGNSPRENAAPPGQPYPAPGTFGRDPWGAWPYPPQQTEGGVMGPLLTRLVDKVTTPPPPVKNPEESIVLQLINKDKEAGAAAALRETERQNEEKRRYDQHVADWEKRRDALETDRVAAHGRELERIREEGKTKDAWKTEINGILRDLDKERTKVQDEQYKVREQAFKDELARTRKEMKDVQDSVKEELAEQRKHIDEEFRLKEKHNDEEFKLKEKQVELRGAYEDKLLELKQKIALSDSTSVWVEGIKEILSRAEGTVKEAISVRKAELAAAGRAGALPEAEADGGNIPPGAETAAEAAAGANGNGNQAGGPGNMKALLDRIMAAPLFQDILAEWGQHIEAGNDPTAFANMFIEWMRDPRQTAEAVETRQACSTFHAAMSSRPWAKMRLLLAPHLSAELAPVFGTPQAEAFYEGFRFIVCGVIRNFYLEYVGHQQAQQQQAQPVATTEKKAPAKRRPQRAAEAVETEAAETETAPETT